TDWQQPLVVAMSQAEGLSIIHETVYENHFGFTDALRSMGAKLQLYRACLGRTPCRFGRRNYLHSAVIAGPAALKGTRIDVPDLRAGFSHLIAALAAQGTTEVLGIELINRGYENFLDDLSGLGAEVSARARAPNRTRASGNSSPSPPPRCVRRTGRVRSLPSRPTGSCARPPG